MNVKGLLKKGDAPYLALLVYRSTPPSNGYSPAELLMNRKIRTNSTSSRETRKPQVPRRKLWLKGKRSRDGNQKEILINVKGLGISPQDFLEIWYGYQTGGNKEL